MQSWNLREIEAPGGSRSPVVLRSDDAARAVLIVLDPGQELGDHQVKECALVAVIDGSIRNPGRVEPPDRPDSMLDPDAIAASYVDVLYQPRSAWTWEIELRPWVERF